MKKYRNISNNRLSIDCMKYTIHMEKGDVQFLPPSLDVRHNIRLGNLVVVRERKPIESIPSKIVELPKQKFKKQWKQVKEENTDSDLKKVETE